MKKILFPLFLLLVLAIPSGKKYKEYLIGYQECLEGEGIVAVQIAANQTFTVAKDVEQTEKIKCECNGTGTVMSPDGITPMKCPCLDANNNCDCKSKKSSEPTLAPEPQVYLPEGKIAMEAKEIPSVQIVMLKSNSCIPCVTFDRRYKDYLIANGYGYVAAEVDSKDDKNAGDESRYAKFRVVNFDKTPNLFYLHNKSPSNSVPQFIVYRNGVYVKHYVGAPAIEILLKEFKG